MVIQAVFPQVLRPHCNTLLFHRCDIPQKRQGYPLLDVVFDSRIVSHVKIEYAIILDQYL